MSLADRMNNLGTETAFEVLAKARALEAQGRDIVHLEIGEPDFETPHHITEAAVQALRDGYTHYGPTAGLPELREEFPIDIVVANAENAAGGLGATAEILDDLAGLGVQAFTLGNHTWRRKSLIEDIGGLENVARPANYPAAVV